MRTLCSIADVPENGAKGFPAGEGSFSGLIAVRQGDAVFVYENACPHVGTPLDWLPDKFLSADGRYLVCATHGAEFTIDKGQCVSGPCQGDYLTQLKAEVRDGMILVESDD